MGRLLGLGGQLSGYKTPGGSAMHYCTFVHGWDIRNGKKE